MTEKPEYNNLAGIALILAGVGLLSTMDSTAKLLIGANYSVLQILALRGWIIVFGMMLMLPRLGGFAALKTTRPKAHLLRAAVGFFAPFMFFSSLKTMPLADTTVIFFGGGTFLMTALSVPLFKERVGPHRWAAIGVGFIGVVIAAQPGSAVFQIDSLYGLGAGIAYALMMLITRWMGSAEGVFRQVFYYNLGLAVIGSISLPYVFLAMPVGDVMILLAMAALATAGQYFLTRAFHVAPVSLLAPFEYSALVWAAGLGYLIWGDVPGNPVLLGAAIIVAGGLYLAHRETLAARRHKRAARQALIVADPIPVIVAIDADES